MRTEHENKQAALWGRIGRAVRARRADLGMAPADLARESGMDLSQLQKFQRGEVGASVAALSRLADALDWTLVDLFVAAYAPRRPRAKQRTSKH